MEPPKHAGDSVGIDMGCVRFCTLSDGTFFEPCGALKQKQKKHRLDAAHSRRS